MDGIEIDFTRICRGCKNAYNDMRDIYGENDDVEMPRLDEMLMACTTIKVDREDGLPNLLCQMCINSLKNSYTFKKQCESVDAALRDYSKHIKKLSSAELMTNILQELFEDEKPLDEQQQKNTTSDNNIVVAGEDNNSNNTENSLKCDYIEIMDNNQLILTCRQCFKVFTTLDGLRCHKRTHTGALFKCKLCDKEYTRLNHLQRHELTHGRRKVHVCKICNKTLTRLEHLKRHLRIHLKEKPYACTKCNRGFNRHEHLATHQEKCKGDRVHICDICNKGFNRADSLEVHRHLHDNKMPVLPTLENLDNIEQHYIEIDYDETANNTVFNDDDDDDDYCDELMDEVSCFEPQVNITTDNEVKTAASSAGGDDKIEEGFDDIKIEISAVDNGVDEENDFNFQEDDNNVADSDGSDYSPTKPTKAKRPRGRPRKASKRGRPPKLKSEIKEEPIEEGVIIDEDDEFDEGGHKCSVCNELFDKLSALEKHASQHEGARVFSCKICSKSFSRSTHVKRHMASHSEVKPFTCEICTKSFTRKDHLTQHMKLHSKAQEFECDVCSKPFSRADHLAKHKFSKHNQGEKPIGEKRFMCAICNKGFTTEKYRDVHMKAHTGEKKFQCKTCDKTFLSKSHLTEHMKFHNDNSKKFLCSECGQRFIRNDYLVIHMRRHRGEKPFKCKFCGKGFPRTTDLTVHERYHTGEKTHLCVICGRGFGRAYNLTVHMRTHTGEKPYQCTYCDAAFAQGNDLKAHVRRHTGERFQCELCTETFLMGYLLTQHKRTVHGLNVVSNIRRLQPIAKLNPDDPPPITISLPQPVVPSAVLNAQLHAQIAVAQLQQQIVRE